MENDLQPKHAYGYIRVSSDKQRDNVSKETQKERIMSDAQNKNVNIVQWYVDDGVSAKDANRKALQELLYDCIHTKNIDYVYVYSMSRLSRDGESFWTNIKSVLKGRGIGIRSATEFIDETPIGQLHEGMSLVMSQYDNNMKSALTKDNMKTLALQGYWQHPSPHGYDNVKLVNEHGKPRPTLKPNAMSVKVHEVLTRFSVGDISQAELTRFARDIGLRSKNGKVLTESSIHLMLTTPEYAGQVHDSHTNYECVEGKHPGIISLEIFETNQRLLNNLKNSRIGEPHRIKNRQYPLKGTLLCLVCKKAMYGSAPQTGNGNHSPRYHCSRPSCKGKMPSLKSEYVHQKFIEALESIKPSPGIVKLYKTILIREANVELDRLNRQIKHIRSELDENSLLKSEAIKKFTLGTLTFEEKKLLSDELAEKTIKLTDDLGQLEKQQAIKDADIEYVINFMKNMSKLWEDASYESKQRFQSMIFPEGVTFDPEIGQFGTSSVSPLYRYVPKEKDAEASKNSNLVAQVHSNWNSICSELVRWLQLTRGSYRVTYSTS